MSNYLKAIKDFKSELDPLSISVSWLTTIANLSEASVISMSRYVFLNNKLKV